MTSKYDLESIELPAKWNPIPLAFGGLVLLVIGALFGIFIAGDESESSMLRFLSHSYLANFMFIMTIALGALFFILIQFVSRAGWSTSIRRIAELIMSTIPFLTLLFLPIIFALFAGKNIPYEWNVPEEVHSSVVKAKIDVGYLTKEWFFIRSIVYFG
ncbi:MAG: hypothetical protein ACKO8U_16005, partial [Pirellula sp.]